MTRNALSPAADPATGIPEPDSAIDLSALAKSEEAESFISPVTVPQEIRDFVHAGHEHWKSAPKKWRVVTLGSEKAVADVKKDATKYAKSIGRTFRTRKHTNPKALIYKVTDAVRGTPSPEAENGKVDG